MSKISEYLQKQLSRRGKRASFAKRLGVTEATVSRWSQGRSLPDFESCLKIARFFRLDPPKVFKMAGKSDHEELYSAFLSEHSPDQLSESDLYQHDHDADLHQRLQSLIDRGRGSNLTVQIELLEAEEALVESEERLRQFAEHSREVFWMAGLTKSEVLYIGPAYEEIWGNSCESLRRDPLSFLDTVHPEDSDRVSAMVEKQRRGEYTDEEYRIMRSDGSMRWVNTRGFPIPNDAGEVYRIAGITRDITERKQAEQELQESQEKYQRLVEGIRDEYFLYSHDTDGHFSYVSPSVTNILGYSQEEFLTHYSEYLTEDCVDQVVHHTTLSIQGEPQSPYEMKIFHKDGSIRRLRVIEVPVFGGDGKVIAVDGIAHDITGRQQMEGAQRSS